MVCVFHCYEFLLLKKLQIDSAVWGDIKENTLKAKGFTIKHVTPELWFVAVTVEKTKDRFPSFLRKLLLQDPHYIPSAGDSLLSRYLRHYEFVEIHLDSIFKYGEGGLLPKEIFRCPNVKVLSLKYNFLERLPSDVGQLQKLEYLALTNNRLENSSIPFSLAFCRHLRVLLLDNNLLDALPGFLLTMPNLGTVHRHGNHNYFKATFMWYHTDVNDRILPVPGVISYVPEPQTLKLLCAVAIIAAKINFFAGVNFPHVLIDYVCSIYFDFNICYKCSTANVKSLPGYKVFTFKNPYLGNTCVPFQHWACSIQCAEAIEVPAREEQILAALEQDRQYNRHVQEAQNMCYYQNKSSSIIPLNNCCVL